MLCPCGASASRVLWLTMWRAEHTVFAVIAFIAALMLFMVYWHRAGDVSQAKPEADCHKAGGVWDSKMNMCMEATVSP